MHKCLGRNLIRLELSAFLPLALNRLPDLELVAEPTWLRDTNTSGLATLPVRVGNVLDRTAIPQPA